MHAIEFSNLSQLDGTTAYFISDNDAGLDMASADKLFGAFQRLHTTDEFPGVGLATIKRLFYLTLGELIEMIAHFST